MPTTDIYIKTCNHDIPYHRYCLQSIDKFCTGFQSTVVEDGEHPRGYLWQQVCKMYADTKTNADMILVTDSDTLFTQPVTPESFMHEGKPIWLYTPWTSEMLAHPGTATWKKVMTEFFGVEPPAEFMRRQPFMFPSSVLATLRTFCVMKHDATLEEYVMNQKAFCLQKHGVSLSEYIMNQKAFSEWNVTGFHCWLHHRDLFHWVDSSVDELPPLRVNQMWSHDPIEKNIEEIRRILL
jgi:hypothetical protein